MMLMVVLLALAPAGARGQSQPAGVVGSGAVPPPAPPYSANPAFSGAMPLPAAQSQIGPGGSLPYAGSMPAAAYPPAGYGYAPGVSQASYPPYGGGAPALPCPPGEALGPGGYDAQLASYLAEDACSNCGGAGCPDCVGLSGLLGRYLSGLLPFSDGGCCAQRWYDVTAEFVSLRRDEASRRMDFASAGILGDIVLSSDDLSFDSSAAFQLRAAAQIFAGSALEFTYLGLTNWSASAAVVDPTDDLFSVFSNFGTDPLQGFDETDRARLQSLATSSSLDSFELHVRKRWIAPNCRLQGSWLAGVRYLYLLEDFEYLTVGRDLDPGAAFAPAGAMVYDVNAKNSLTGFQLGGDLWTCVVPGISLGGELKAGIYGNYAQQGTHVLATTTDPNFAGELFEQDTAGSGAFVGQGNIMLVYRTSPNWTLRGGYTFLYADGVALAVENFNSTYPFSTVRGEPRVNHNGSVFYHGFTAGLEWMW